MKLRMQLIFLVVSLMCFMMLSNSCSSQQQEDDLYEQEDENYSDNYNENQEQGNLGETFSADSNGNADEVAQSQASLPLDVANFSNYQGNSNASMGANSGGFVSGVAGTPAGPGLPELGAKMPYIVRNGDTFSNISIRIYGSGSKAVELAENTGVGKNDMIFPGDIIYYQLTRESLSFAGRYESLARQEVIIQEGDTLSKIAYKFYGSHKKWRGIWRANNQIKDPDMLKVGEKIFVITKEAYASLDKRHDNASESITASLTSEKNNEIADVIKSDASKLNTKNQVNNILTANEADEEMLLKGLEENSSLKNRVLEMDLGLDLDPEIFEEDGELKVSKRQNWEEQIPNWGV